MEEFLLAKVQTFFFCFFQAPVSDTFFKMSYIRGVNFADAQTPFAQPPKESTRRIVKSAPKYPKFTTRFSRLETFKNCRDIAVTPENLSDAGFFYAGIGDCTRCFYCGIGKKPF